MKKTIFLSLGAGLLSNITWETVNHWLRDKLALFETTEMKRRYPQLAESRDKFVHVILKQRSSDIRPELSKPVGNWHFFRTSIERAQAKLS